MLRLLPIFLLPLSACAAPQEQETHQQVEATHAHGQEPELPLTSGRIPPPEQTCFDVTHYGLTLKVDPKRQTIGGEMQMTADLVTASDGIILDLDGHLTVFEVALRAVNSTDLPAAIALPFEHKGGEVRINVAEAFKTNNLQPGGNFTIGVHFGGHPRTAPRPPWDGGFQWDKTADGSHWIATSCQMQGADLWWPCKDQPDDEPNSMDLSITVPEGLICASNGKLVGVTTADGWSTFDWHVSTLINIYGIALNIAPYEVITREVESTAGDRFEVTYYVLPENLERGKVLFEDLIRQVRWFEETYGPYPFRGDKLGLVETPHLGMEHQSITAYGSNYSGNPWGADQGFDFLLHHELSHEWWANLVTCRNWSDFWIHESFGTYAQSLYTESLNGKQAYRARMAEIRRGIRNRAPLAPPAPMSSSDVYFGKTGGDIYNKGAWVLHTLRWLVNDDDKFFLTLRRMAYPDPALEALTDGSACRFTDTNEIQAIGEQHTGLDLSWFFNVYMHQPKLPQLEREHRGGELHLTWSIPGSPGLIFPMPVEAMVDGRRVRVEMPGGKGVLDVEGFKEVVIDPDAWLLME